MLAENDSEQTDCSARALWPTPSACNANDGEGAQTWLERRERLKAKGYNGNGAGIPLAIAVQVPRELAPAPSISSSVGPLASRLRQLVSALATGTIDGSGAKLCALSATSDRAGPYWSSLQASLAFDTQTGSRPLDEYSSSWPRWGTVAGGVSGQPRMWALRTDATECSSSPDEQTWSEEQEGWPTPRQAATRSSRASVTRQGHWSAPALEQMAELAQGEIPREYQEEAELTPQARRVYGMAQAQMWATPTANGEKLSATPTPGMGAHWRRKRGNILEQVADQQWPIPTAQDGENNAGASQHQRHALPLNAAVGGSLNPRWVCLMMALPADYLDIPPLPGQGGRRVRAMRSTSTSRPDLLEECPSE